MSSRPSRGTARLAAILDALPDGLLLVNANGTVVNANSIALDMFETPGTALVGRGLLDLLPEFDSKLIPGSMRRPGTADERGRTKPARMMARRTDRTDFPVEITSASLDSGQASYGEFSPSYTGDELLMLVVRDLSGTVDTEAELARSQRQTEMILRAASEGVVGTDTEGRVVLVNPAAAQILGFRASDLGGKELHPLILHSRAEGDPFPYEESPLADTLRSGRKHRVRGQVLWSKSGARVPVDLTTAPVRDGDQLVGAVMTFTDRRPYEELTEQHTAAVEELTGSHTAEVASLTEMHAAEIEALTEQHAAEIADRTERYASELEEQADRIAALEHRHGQLTAVLGESLRGPLEQLRGELSTLAADPAGQLWPEANQILHHLAAGYARMTTLIDNVLGYQRLDAGAEGLAKAPVMLDAVVTAGIDGAVELIGPGRAQFAVHAPPIEAEVDARQLATALAHLVADVAGIDSTGKTRVVPGGGYLDSTVVVAAAQRGDVVRIEVRGPFAGGDPVHEPIVRGIVRAHGGVLQTHEMPGLSGSAYVLEVPLGTGGGTVAPEPAQVAAEALPEQDNGAAGVVSGGRRRARRSSTDAFLDSPVGGPAGAEASGDTGAAEPTGRRRARRGPAAPEEQTPDVLPVRPGEGSGRRRGRPSPAETGVPGAVPEGGGQAVAPAGAEVPRQALALPSASGTGPSEGSVVTSAEAQGGNSPQRGTTVPPQGVPPQAPLPVRPARPENAGRAALPARASASDEARPVPAAAQPTGRRARRALAAAQERLAAESAGPRTTFALPPADADRPSAPSPVQPEGMYGPQPYGPVSGTPADGRGAGDGAPAAGHAPDGAAPARPAFPAQGGTAPAGPARTPAPPNGAVPSGPVPHSPVPNGALPPCPVPNGQLPNGRLSTGAAPGGATPIGPATAGPAPVGAPPNDFAATGSVPDRHDTAPSAPDAGHTPPPAHPAPSGRRRARSSDAPELPAGPPVEGGTGQYPAAPPQVPAAGPTTHATGTGEVPRAPLSAAARRQPLPAEAPAQPEPSPDSTQGRAFSVRTLGQGVPFVQQHAHQQNQSFGGAGRRRKLSAPPEPTADPPAPQQAPPAPRQHTAAPTAVPATAAGRLMTAPAPEGRAYAIGAPDEGAEGPEPLDGPGGAVEVANRPQPQPVDDEMPPEPLDNPRRLLVWPAPDVSTQQALSDRGYRPVIVHSREEVDAQIAAFPAALFVDPLTGPITRTALRSLRQAAVAAEVPVLVTAGLGQATREAAYGADPAVLLKALAPRDSEQHPPRVLVIEEQQEIALALGETLERRGMQVGRAATDSEAVDLASRMRPNLVVMDLMQVRRRRAGIIDWLRSNGRLNRTPLVVYTSAGMEPDDLARLSTGESVLFLAERSTSDEVQSRIVDLLAKIGTN
ncbi:PAS domain-containing protein [uncultured Streptomyces sp.]|uniref:PAS domain-containing protein n=1 Tax=uncultured Streptomyces sp. TaxID=174707 RepID=UPI00260C6440|nr:PAS domain-containing protein [uncultured Streptomyces sp.]